jgi:uncharacterized protein
VSDGVVSLMLWAAGRTLLLRDRLSGRMAERLKAFPFEDERFTLSSGGRSLSAVYVSAGQGAPVFLICHGIGERVEYWGDVQRLLKQMGISSMVFNYTGFGESSGMVRTGYCEEDAVTAFNELISRGARSIFLLGFSLGSGVASAIAARLDADGLILCEGFSSLRDAAGAAGLPRSLTFFAEHVWPTTKLVSELDLPVLVVHSDADGLFPVSMAERVTKACKRGESVILKGFGHNAPIFAAAESYWRPIADWAKRLIESEKISRR